MTKISMFIFAFLFSLTSFAGQFVGNGGDVITCTKSEDNGFEGMMTLDYVLLSRFETRGAGYITPVTDWASTQKRITDLLRQACPILANDLEIFYQYSNNYKNWLAPYMWLGTRVGLVQLEDEKIVRQLPENCKTNGKANIIQAVIRKPITSQDGRISKVIFEFDSAIMAKLWKTPEQYSFLMLHEFLWNSTDNVDSVRWLNYFLHSRAADKMSPAEVREVIKSFLPDIQCTTLQ